MLSLVTLLLGTLIGIFYFFINLFNIRNLDVDSTNYFRSLNGYGRYLTYIMKGVFCITAVTLLCASLLLTVKSEFRLFLMNINLYWYSLLGVVLCYLFMLIIGYLYIKYNFVEIEISLQENRVNTNNTEYEFMCNSDINFNYKCCICLQEKNFKTRAVITPCKHQSFCKDCGLRVGNLNNCPLCRGEIRKITIYIKNIL